MFPPPQVPARRKKALTPSTGLLICLALLLVAAGCGTVLLDRHDHTTLARIMCRRFVRHKLNDARFSAERVRDLSPTTHRVTGTAHHDGKAGTYACTVRHTGRTWVLVDLTGP